MDWATWIRQTFDENGRPQPAFLNFEATVRKVDEAEEYVAEKILNLVRLVDARGGISEAVERLKDDAAFAGYETLPDQPTPYLIFVTNRADRLPAEAGIRALLKGRKGAIAGSHPTIDCRVAGPSNESLVVTTRSGVAIHVGLVGTERLIEMVYLTQALDGAKRHDLVNERFLYELTSLASKGLLLQPMPRTVDAIGLAPGANLRMDGKSVTLHRFSVEPFHFVRMSTVLRLVSDYSYLQRLPDGARLADMATAIQSGDRFPTPVLCMPPHGNVVEERQKILRQAGSGLLTPYGWHIIDGQHRVFCYYFIDNGVQVQSIDVNAYEVNNPNDKASIASALFLDVNFKAERPSEDLGLAYYAFAHEWPGGDWIPRKGRGRARMGSKDFYSSRILASRFLLELSKRDTLYRDFFKARGARDPGKVSIRSLSTYLAPEFDLLEPDDPENPVASKFGTVSGATAIWKTPRPPPDSLTALWDELTGAFDEFSVRVAASADGSRPSAEQKLRDLIKSNNNVFVGLWKGFFWYSIRTAGGESGIRPIPEKRAAMIMRWLQKEHAQGHLTGRTNRYKSGSGSKSLPARLIRLIGPPQPP